MQAIAAFEETAQLGTQCLWGQRLLTVSSQMTLLEFLSGAAPARIVSAWLR
jgi:hypothetical protein